MRYASGHKEQTRAKILEAASRIFRDQGYHPTGIDRVMESAGLTSGGFYAHFDSKQALLIEVLTHTEVDFREHREELLKGLSGREWVEAFLDYYLGSTHRKNPEAGCPLVALISEVARADDSVKARFEAMILSLGEELAARAGDREPGTSSERAMAAVALCVGGLGLARSVQDESFAEKILEACRNQAREILVGDRRSPETEG